MGGGAWPFLVGGVICLVNSVNERDLSLLTSRSYPLLIRCSGSLRGVSVRLWTVVDRRRFRVFGLPGLNSRALFNFLEGLSVCSGWKFEAITGL